MEGTDFLAPSEDLVFQATDWRAEDLTPQQLENNPESSSEEEEDRNQLQYCINIFGKQSNGTSVSVRISNFTPYFYFMCPQDWMAYQLDAFVQHLHKRMSPTCRESFLKHHIVQRKKFRGFSNHALFKFVRVVFQSSKAMKNMMYLLLHNNRELDKMHYKSQAQRQGKKWRKTCKFVEAGNKCRQAALYGLRGASPNLAEYCYQHGHEMDDYEDVVRHENRKIIKVPGLCSSGIKIELYESNIDPMLRFMHIQNISPSGWIRISADNYQNNEPKMSTCEVDVSVPEWNHVHSQELSQISPIIVASYDIEADSSHGDFPLAKKDYKKLAINLVSQCWNLYQQCQQQIKPWLDIQLLAALIGYAFSDQSNDQNIDRIFSKEGRCPKSDTIQKVAGLVSPILKGIVEIKDRDQIVEQIADIMNRYFPPVEGDRTIQIGTVFYRYGEPNCFLKHIITLGGCEPVSGVEVESYPTEKEVLLAWTQLIQRINPDIITGYNIFGFDYKFLWERAHECYCLEQFQKLSKYRERGCKFVTQTLSSAGLGDNELHYIDMAGRVQVDLYKIAQRDYRLASYKLDSVADHFITGSILEVQHLRQLAQQDYTALTTDNVVSLRKNGYIHLGEVTVNGVEHVENGKKYQIVSIEAKQEQGELEQDGATDNGAADNRTTPQLYEVTVEGRIDLDSGKKYQWGLAKDDVGPKDIFRLQKGDDSDRAIIAKYCVQDCELCIHLLKKLEIVANNIGMANVCSVPLSFIFLRGQGVKICSLVAKQCRLDSYLIPTLDREVSGEEGRAGYEGAIVLAPKPGIYLDDPIAVLDYASLYPSSMISENLSHDSIVLTRDWLGKEGATRLGALKRPDGGVGYQFVDVTYDNYRYIPKGKSFVKLLDKKHPTVTCRFIQPKEQPDGTILTENRAVIPRILQKLLTARKETRKKIPNEPDPFKQSVLEGLQLAYKVTANSLYGALGASTSPIYFKDIAASTTATGRKLLNLARDYVEKNYEGAETVYGDTDSIFINFNPKDGEGNKLTGKEALKESIQLGLDVEKNIKPLLKIPHKLEYEKTFWPFILLSKKRYVGNKYETDPDKYKQNSMGIVLKRRDNAPIVKYIYGGVIDIIMNQCDVNKAFEFFLTSCLQLLEGKFPVEKLIITKSLKGFYKDPERIAHKVLADRIAKRDPGNKPQANDRMAYIYIERPDPARGETQLQGDKIETPQFIRDNSLKPDYLFYISNQIMKPVSQLFALALEQLPNYRDSQGARDRVAKKWREMGKEEKRVEEKVQEMRMKEIEEMVWNTAALKNRARVIQNEKNGVKEISDWFGSSEARGQAAEDREVVVPAGPSQMAAIKSSGGKDYIILKKRTKPATR